MKKNVRVFFMLLICLFGLSINSYAQSFNLKANPEEKIVAPGETVEIELNLENITDIDEGINTVVGHLEYEQDLFEAFEFLGDNEWTVTYNDDKSSELYGKFAVITIQNGVTENSKIANLKLTLKGNLSDGETEIKFKNIVSSDGFSSINTDDKKVKLIIKNVVKDENNSKLSEKDIKSENGAINQIIRNIRTGDNVYIYIGIFLLAVVGIVIIVIIKKTKSKKDKNK